ncbi:MAG: hypothetical protein EOO77_31755 [Oxalobacteraceae bacterium]|nr:MAG: hypothetical protein EOO77_31755 [Oxalobacteraceae bacterium]
MSINGVADLFSIEIVRNNVHPYAMPESLHLSAIAHSQGIQAAKTGKTPLDCPWPTRHYETCQAWYAGYSVAVIATRYLRTCKANMMRSARDICPIERD